MRSSREIKLEEITAEREYRKSPEAWEEQILYFLLVDRFARDSDEPLYNPEEDYENALKTEESKQEWLEAGDKWNGGSLQGIISHLDYLQELGVTALWISPILKQTPFSDSYHGYGIHNFLAIDPHFGSKEDLKQLVEAAHARDMLVILDVIINHTGDVFAYEGEAPAYDGNEHPVSGFRDENAEPKFDPEDPDYEEAWPDGGVWPQELFHLETFSCKGYITNWEEEPEYIQGDFFSLKNIYTGEGEIGNFHASPALETLTKCYKYWIAYADLDGFRLDTVKHLQPGATSYFVTEIHEFAHTLGKKNFYIIGEITGGIEFAKSICDRTGLNAALGINKIPDSLENMAKGYQEASNYFSIFSNTEFLDDGELKWHQKNVITMFDDHDMVYQQEYKSRFAADKETAPLLGNAIFLNFFTSGIPCIYYGTEQGFDGSGDQAKYVREAMFGSKFGAFRSQGRSFFDQEHHLYKAMREMAALRQEHDGLKLGRQYLRELAQSGEEFGFPVRNEERYSGIIAWARIFSRIEFLLAINCDLETERTAKVMVDNDIHEPGDMFTCIYSSRPDQLETSIPVKALDADNYYVEITV
ncbi:MAG: alpha-amylase family glycosyl hydrolase, partial [Bacillota bacterium]